MAATGFTPIQLYRTSTSGASPTSGNLNAGELAINYNTADMSVWALNTGGSVIRLMNNPAGLKYPTADGTANQIIKTDGSGNLTFVTPATGTVTSVTGTAPVVSSGGATPTISMAAATSSVNGYLTSTDWTTFNNKYSTGGALGTPSSGTLSSCTGLSLTTGVSGTLPVASGGTGTTTPALVAGTNVTITGTWPNQTINSTGGGSGTVTSVGMTVPSFLSVSPSSISSSGTFAVTFSTSTNIYIGQNSGSSNTTGNNNTAIGSNASVNNSTGYGVVAIGEKSQQVCTANENTSVGWQSLSLMVSGQQNTAIGSNAMSSSASGDLNTAVGRSALSSGSMTGSQNVAIGALAFNGNTTGSYNTVIGTVAGQGNTTGNGNIAVGGLTSAGSNSPVFSLSTASNRIVMGSSAATNAYVQVAWTVVSDARDKTNFAPVPHGLDFVNKLLPTAYQFKVSREDDTPTGILRYGFKAQDILELEGDIPVIIDNEDVEKLRFNSDSLIPVLVNAIKELTARLETLENKVA
jgi:hypothetical protein